MPRDMAMGRKDELTGVELYFYIPFEANEALHCQERAESGNLGNSSYSAGFLPPIMHSLRCMQIRGLRREADFYQVSSNHLEGTCLTRSVVAGARLCYAGRI